MKLALDSAGSGYLVRVFAHGRIVLARTGEGAGPPLERVLTASAIVSPWDVVEDWSPPAFGPEFGVQSLGAALALDPEVLLLGSGQRLRWPAPGLVREINARGAGCEVMDTGSACRTYNVLALEGRRVVAALVMD